MTKYSVVFDFGGVDDYKELQEAAETAKEIAKVSAGIAPNIYMLLCCYAKKMMLTIDDTEEYGAGMIEYGISILQDLGYIEVGGECEEDYYKMIYIVK